MPMLLKVIVPAIAIMSIPVWAMAKKKIKKKEETTYEFYRV